MALQRVLYLSLKKQSTGTSEVHLAQIEQTLSDSQSAVEEGQKALNKLNAVLTEWELRLSNLTNAQRQFIEARYRDGKSMKEIQNELGVSPKQIQKVPQQALNLLRELA